MKILNKKDKETHKLPLAKQMTPNGGKLPMGLSFQSHDPSQRSQGFLTLAGGIVITFAKEILNLITG